MVELIENIINELADATSLNSALIKTKILAIRLDNKNLLEWINKELAGYKINEHLPAYRKTNGEVCGDYINGKVHAKNTIIPFPEFNEEITKSLYEMHFYQSIQTLESLTSNGNQYVAQEFEISQKKILYDYLQSQNPRLSILNIYQRTPSTFIQDIFSVVRDNLLELMLEIEKSFNHISEIKELKKYNSQINNIMNNTIIGDGNIQNSGSQVSIKAEINIGKGDKINLKKHLLNSQVSENDADELLNIIDTETPISKNRFGTKVSFWIAEMLNKSLNGTWDVSVGAAGAILADAIIKYYSV